VKSYRSSQGNKKSHSTQAQEAARKDVERAFGVGSCKILGQGYAMVHIDSICDHAYYDN